MMYSNGCPILYPIAFLNFVIVYWTYKVLLISYYRKSVSFDENMAMNTMKLFTLGLILHLGTSMLMFSNHDILSTTRIPEEYVNHVFKLAAIFTANNYYVLVLIERLSHPLALIYAGWIGCVVAAFILKETVLSLLEVVLGKIIRIICCCFFKSAD